MKRLAALTVEIEKCDVETDNIKDVYDNKTIKYKEFPTLIKNCKPFVVVSVLFLCIIILTGVMV